MSLRKLLESESAFVASLKATASTVDAVATAQVDAAIDNLRASVDAAVRRLRERVALARGLLVVLESDFAAAAEDLAAELPGAPDPDHAARQAAFDEERAEVRAAYKAQAEAEDKSFVEDARAREVAARTTLDNAAPLTPQANGFKDFSETLAKPSAATAEALAEPFSRADGTPLRHPDANEAEPVAPVNRVAEAPDRSAALAQAQAEAYRERRDEEAAQLHEDAAAAVGIGPMSFPMEERRNDGKDIMEAIGKGHAAPPVTPEEALADPAAFVAGMTETSRVATAPPAANGKPKTKRRKG